MFTARSHCWCREKDSEEDSEMAAEWKETLETEREISAFMLELGIPAHLRGYYYLREAVLLAVSDMELVGSVTKLLYPVIARRYKTTLQRVERAIRNAVEVSWERGNPEVFEDLLSKATTSHSRAKITSHRRTRSKNEKTDSFRFHTGGNHSLQRLQSCQGI